MKHVSCVAFSAPSKKNKKKQCVIIQDEIYVKKMLLYHGGTLFGRATDDS